jgi:hypothetical protein
MKREIITNGYMYRVCVPSISTKPKQHGEKFTKVSALKDPLPRNPEFNEFVLEAIDEGLSSLGDSSKQAIYYHLEKNFRIKKPDIPNKIEEFANAMEKIFGDGAKLLEIEMMRRLYDKVGHTLEYLPEGNDLLFTEYMNVCKGMFRHKQNPLFVLPRLK